MTKKDAKATSSPVKEKAETVPTEPASTSETKPENTTINQPEKPRVYNKKIPWYIYLIFQRKKKKKKFYLH